ncbi:uncharacterized protein MONBRDRAFT_7513 [Monosiga brevicollis MX1]|uniref:PH domain-containing protein n=1 Tax=Monosiga brevicollis TaxID=81824 RepID=A9UX76_MONBE|nr:uncharacterized protein MONBRDRAFT_7513 [Monosiga brevicollis MX1]EDQ90169.1 predicted protein [Monosiga brevicollis MX1]|eukprot:XP_001744936.1 hypothetical protein [Monosiga brevicollis MX1]
MSSMFQSLRMMGKSLSSAAEAGDVDAVQSLLSSSETPLHISANVGHVEVMQTLINYGADPLEETKDGTSPLELAAGVRGQLATIVLVNGSAQHERLVELLEDLDNASSLELCNLLDTDRRPSELGAIIHMAAGLSGSLDGGNADAIASDGQAAPRMSSLRALRNKIGMRSARSNSDTGSGPAMAADTMTDAASTESNPVVEAEAPPIPSPYQPEPNEEPKPADPELEDPEAKPEAETIEPETIKSEPEAIELETVNREASKAEAGGDLEAAGEPSTSSTTARVETSDDTSIEDTSPDTAASAKEATDAKASAAMTAQPDDESPPPVRASISIPPPPPSTAPAADAEQSERADDAETSSEGSGTAGTPLAEDTRHADVSILRDAEPQAGASSASRMRLFSRGASAPAPAVPRPVTHKDLLKEGPLWKKPQIRTGKINVNNKARLRWFVLQETTLSYYDYSPESTKKRIGKIKGCIPLNTVLQVQASHGEGDEATRCFEVIQEDAALFCVAGNMAERDAWVTAICRAWAAAETLIKPQNRLPMPESTEGEAQPPPLPVPYADQATENQATRERGFTASVKNRASLKASASQLARQQELEREELGMVDMSSQSLSWIASVSFATAAELWLRILIALLCVELWTSSENSGVTSERDTDAARPEEASAAEKPLDQSDNTSSGEHVE